MATPGGDDVAFLYDDPNGSDTFWAWPTQAELFGDGFYNRVKSFRSVHALASGNEGDVAALHDDPGAPDTLKAWPTEARLYGAGYTNTATGFPAISAYGTAGDGDLAQLYDDPTAKDTLSASPQLARLYGTGYDNQAASFDRVEAYATEGGEDLAFLFDSALDDLLEARDNWARLSNAGIPFTYLAVAFQTVEATLTGEGDTKDIDPAVNFVITHDLW